MFLSPIKVRTACRVLSTAILFTGVLAAPAIAQVSPFLTVDANTGAVFSHRNAFKRWSPASLTKLMTAYVTFRALRARELTLKSPVRQSKNSRAEPPSKMGYKVGSILTVDNAL